jgi:type IX secretion system substrate protein
VLSAELSLYAWDATNGFGQHSSLSGSNEAWLRRVTSPWNESTVTWNTAPSSTTTNQVSVPGTSNPLQNYVDMDVTVLVQDMVNDPANSHGFLLREKTESYYRRMNFCTSDHPNSQLHPKLSITYTALSTAVPDPVPATDLQVFPNPAQDEVVVVPDRVGAGPVTLQLVDAQGQILRSTRSTDARVSFDTRDVAAGTYHVRLLDDSAIHTRRLVIVR